MGLGDINYVLHLCKDNRWISHKLSTEKSAVGNEPICKSYHLCNVIKLRVSLTFETLTRYYSREQDNCITALRGLVQLRTLLQVVLM